MGAAEVGRQMLLVQMQDRATAEWPEDALINAVQAGTLHPDTPVSLDRGQSWQPARGVVLVGVVVR